MNHVVKTETAYGPTPEALTQSEITWIEPLRYERGNPIARKQGLHVALRKSGRLNEGQYAWVERYAAETEIASGAKLGKPEMERVDEWQGPKIYDRRTAAVGWLRLVATRINKRQRMLLEAACVHVYRLADCAIVAGVFPRDDEKMKGFEDRTREIIYKKVIEIIELGCGIDN